MDKMRMEDGGREAGEEVVSEKHTYIKYTLQDLDVYMVMALGESLWLNNNMFNLNSLLLSAFYLTFITIEVTLSLSLLFFCYLQLWLGHFPSVKQAIGKNSS